VKEGDKNPKALAGTEDEELGGIVLRPVKPRILPKLQHSLHNDQAEPCCPDEIIKFAERISFGAIDLWRFAGEECRSCECVRVR